VAGKQENERKNVQDVPHGQSHSLFSTEAPIQFER
jgi:hypothetical protein